MAPPDRGRGRRDRVTPRQLLFMTACLCIAAYGWIRGSSRCATAKGSTPSLRQAWSTEVEQITQDSAMHVAAATPMTQAALAATPAAAEKSKEEGEAEKWAAIDRMPLFRQIEKDLAPWAKSGISEEMVTQAMCGSAHGGFRVQIIDNHAWVSGDRPGTHSRGRFVKLQIQDMLSRGLRVPDVDFYIDLYDRPELPKDPDHPCGVSPLAGPVLVMGKAPEYWHGVMVPDWSFGGWWEVGTPGWHDVRGILKEAAEAVPWEKKINKVFFRGGQTSDSRGAMFESKEIQGHPLFDVKQTSPYYDDATAYVTLSEHCQYKYLVHLQGHTYSNRLKWLMLCNSTVIVPKSKWMEFYYEPLLRDNVNVVMMDAIDRGTAEDIIEVVERLEAEPGRACGIASAGFDTMWHELTPDIVARYWQQLFIKYSALQTFQPRRPDKPWPENAVRLGQSIAWPMYVDRTCACFPAQAAWNEDREKEKKAKEEAEKLAKEQAAAEGVEAGAEQAAGDAQQEQAQQAQRRQRWRARTLLAWLWLHS